MNETQGDTISWFNSTEVSVEKYFFFSSLALIIIFAWMEPVGAAGIGFWRGLLFWSIQISILIPLLIATQNIIAPYLDIGNSKAPWIQTVLAGMVASLLFVPLAYSLDVLFAIPDDATAMGLIPGLLDEAAGVLVPVTITWLALNAPWIYQLDFSRKKSNASNHTQTENETVFSKNKHSRFLQELRSRASGELVSISSELHYLRVTTTCGEVMFLYNLKDAIEELPPDSGVQIHRSHWVSKKHVKQVLKKKGNAECILSCGKSLPVSRRKYAEVKELLAYKIP